MNFGAFPNRLFGFLSATILFFVSFIITDIFLFLIFGSLFGWFSLITFLNAIAYQLPLRIGRSIHWIHALSFEWIALVSVPLLRILHRKSSEEGRGGEGRPILLVHGYLNHGSVWLYQKKALEKKGFGPVYTIHLGYPFLSIASYAEKVRLKADEIAKKRGRDDLILIGHSMGGVVSAWYATQIAPVGKVTDLITIGSPLAGTHVAKVALGTNGREMQRDSILIQKLRLAISKNKTIRFFHIGTKSDQLIIPWNSSLIDGHDQYVIEDIGHASLLYSKRVTDQICKWLSSP